MKVDFQDRSARLHELRQSLTYEGLLEGLPTVEGNQRRIKYVLQKSESQRYGVGPYLVPPVEKPIERPSGEPYPFGTPSSLPSVTCIARFEAIGPTVPGKGDGSGLVVVWFQECFALPIDSEVLLHLRNLDWNRHAGSYEF
jgi:hypothetical protein